MVFWTNVTGVGTDEARMIDDFVLEGNYRNPFNPSTRLRYSIPHAGAVTVRIYNALGSLVTTLQQGHVPAGRHEVVFEADSLASGLYLYEVVFDGARHVGRMSLPK